MSSAAERAAASSAKARPPLASISSRRAAAGRTFMDRSCAILGAEGHAAPGRRDQHAVGHLGSRLLHEVQAAAMHRDEHVGLKLLDLGYDLLEVVGWCRPEMESTDDRVHLLNA